MNGQKRPSRKRRPSFRLTKLMRRPMERTAAVREKYPKIVASDFMSADGITVIVDTGSMARDRKAVRKLQLMNRQGASKAVIHLVNGPDLTKKMLGLVRANMGAFRGRRVLVVYPGEAAKIVKGYVDRMLAGSKNEEMKRVFSNTCPVRAKRIVRKGKPTVEVDVVPLERLGRADVVLVVDDVVSSGQTAGNLCRNSIGYAYETVDATELHLRARSEIHRLAANATWPDWYLATWVMAEPVLKGKESENSGLAGIKGYEKVFAAGIIKPTAGQIPAINSLSTLLRGDQKGRVVRQSFVEKAVNDRKLFGRIISRVRNA